MKTRTIARGLSAASIAAIALTAAGCGSGSSDSSDSSSDGGTTEVNVSLENKDGKDTCSIDKTEANGGPVKFNVENKSASGITEVELLQDQRILGEKENLAPGLAPVSFTVTLSGGDYQVYCPGAETEMQDFKVTGDAAKPTGDTQELLQQGADQYADFVKDQVGQMNDAVKKLQEAVDKGDVEAAKKAYADARPFYEKVESDVDSFLLPGGSPDDNATNLDYLIDMRQSNIDKKVGWHGFHAIERDLWQGKKIDDGTKKYAKELTDNVGKLNEQVQDLKFKPEDLANGAAGLLEEVQSEKITGEEEAYSHLDLVDFAANVEGAQDAFASLKPGLEKIDPDLTKKISGQFDKVRKDLNAYRDADALGGYKAWTPELRKKDANKLSQSVQGLQDPLSTLAEKVAKA
ncbi:peptidase M75 [Brevibacterium sp. 5221]|uniref:Peptidase M75 n=1 Tax=Brevibacterium rongguiense TaxID=2695267 RepID=A0A6N9H5J3_9MICO|nr:MULTISPECIES: iron uptake system protein EfeO [Brevibacterium]MYM19337.1 peptidase M75 [Brevibacterium rongguiense]WAL39481.1 EfeM/EfeO family lipoprotein [Brevibacterium sp. BRM-1]